MIEARVVADSINPDNNRLATFVCTYPRFIHSEIMTHRVFSRNAASSRAIPVEKMIERVLREPAMPVSWGKNQKGMQADEELDGDTADKAKREWCLAAELAVGRARRLLTLGVHKQIANRLLEPFAHMTTIITASEWGNFFNLRAHKDAQPEFQELAFQMLLAYRDSKPTRKAWGQWHLPFADQYVADKLTQEQLMKIVVARCARVSYLNFEGDIDHEKDYKLHDDLLVSGHMSPFEHAAYADPEPDLDGGSVCGRAFKLHSSNFRGWVQYRKTIRNENREVFNTEELLKCRKK